MGEGAHVQALASSATEAISVLIVIAAILVTVLYLVTVKLFLCLARYARRRREACVLEKTLPSRVQASAAADCAICLERIDPGEEVRALQCKHEFHLECVTTWLRAKRVCPICKSDAVNSSRGSA